MSPFSSFGFSPSMAPSFITFCPGQSRPWLDCGHVLQLLRMSMRKVHSCFHLHLHIHDAHCDLIFLRLQQICNPLLLNGGWFPMKTVWPLDFSITTLQPIVDIITQWLLPQFNTCAMSSLVGSSFSTIVVGCSPRTLGNCQAEIILLL